MYNTVLEVMPEASVNYLPLVLAVVALVAAAATAALTALDALTTIENVFDS